MLTNTTCAKNTYTTFLYWLALVANFLGLACVLSYSVDGIRDGSLGQQAHMPDYHSDNLWRTQDLVVLLQK